jgi:hypothetical protein
MGADRRAGILAVAVAVLFTMGGQARSDFQPEFNVLLSRDLGFSSGDLADLEHGKIVRHLLTPTSREEIGVVGAVRIRGARDRLIAAYRDIVTFRKSAGPVLGIGRFSDPPKPADLDSLTTTRDDFDLRHCRVGDCDIRLPSTAIERIGTSIDWRRPGADAQASALFKEILLTHVQSYVTGGPGRIERYDDGRTPILTTRAADDLIKASPFLDALKPGLAAHVQCLWSNPLDGADDFVYWSKEKFGFAPFISVTHVTIAPSGPHQTVAINRDVYSSRYIDAAMSMMVTSDAVSDPEWYYLVYLNRSRASVLRGPMAGLLRPIVERKARISLESYLRDLKARIETPVPRRP